MIYLDNAATSFPKPASVADEVSRCIREYCGNPGRGSHRMAMRAAETLFEAREKLDRMFSGHGADSCVFTLNTTYALNIALKSLVKRGCHVLISDMEHNSVYRQVVSLRASGIADFDIFSTFGGDANAIVKDINRKLNDRTRIILCQHMSNICSQVLPLERIGKLCREKGIFFIADAAQSAGVIDIDMKKIGADAVCLPSHKSLYGPQGAGAVLFSPRVRDRLAAFIEGGSGSNSLDPFMPRELPDRFEAGTMATPAIAGLNRGLEFVEDVGIGKIAEHERNLAKYLTDELLSDRAFEVFRPDSASGVVLFNIRGTPSSSVSSELDLAGICTRSGFHCAPLAHRTLCTGPSALSG